MFFRTPLVDTNPYPLDNTRYKPIRMAEDLYFTENGGFIPSTLYIVQQGKLSLSTMIRIKKDKFEAVPEAHIKKLYAGYSKILSLSSRWYNVYFSHLTLIYKGVDINISYQTLERFDDIKIWVKPKE